MGSLRARRSTLSVFDHSLSVMISAAAVLASLLVPLWSAPSLAATTSTAPAYDLVSANGTVSSFGGAGNYGGTQNRKLAGPIVSMATTPDGKGYWLAGSNGSVFNFGDAVWYHSLAFKQLSGAHAIVSIVPTADGKGYWLCDRSGHITAFGDAPKLPSLHAGFSLYPIVSFAVLRDQQGAWMLNSAGMVFRIGKVQSFGNVRHLALASPMVGMVPTVSDGGYWLAEADGQVFPFGDAEPAATPPATFTGSLVGITAAPSGAGYWAASTTGSVVASGVPSEGSLTGRSGALQVTAVTAAPSVDPAPTDKQVALAQLAYDLVSANGTVTGFGGAGNYGGTAGRTLAGPIVAMVPTPDGGGYWLAGSNGSVFNFGDARWFGSLAGRDLQSPNAIVGITATSNGAGYWLCDENGQIASFGNAAPLPALQAGLSASPIVACSVLPGGKGAWLVNSAGVVFGVGTTTLYGDLSAAPPAYPIVGMAATSDSRGYWLVNSAGDVYPFGDAGPAVAPPSGLTGTVVGVAAAPGGAGYWAVSSTGTVIAGGTSSRGGLSGESGPLAITAMAATRLPSSIQSFTGYPTGAIGYDVNWPQCKSSDPSAAGALPGPPSYVAGSMAYAVAVVGVDGWAVGSYNPCLAAEATWASKAKVAGTMTVPPYELYLFLNSPASNSTIDKTGPAGTCANLAASARPACLAYNYGYNAALDAVSYASGKGAQAKIWWLDIENDACATGEWNNAGAGEWWSCNKALNDRTIQGAINALRHQGRTVGIYSTAVQWRGITGGYTPLGAQVLLWIAGAYWTSPPYPSSYHYYSTSHLAAWCQGSYNFAGGRPVLLQETPGSNGYPFDPDYAC